MFLNVFQNMCSLVFLQQQKALDCRLSLPYSYRLPANVITFLNTNNRYTTIILQLTLIWVH